MNLWIVVFVRIFSSKPLLQAWQASPLLEATNHEVDHFVVVRLFLIVVGDCGERLVDDRYEHAQQDEEEDGHVQYKHERSNPTSLQQILHIVC